MWHWVTDMQIWISLITLTVMEIVLGIDNIVFITILAGKLPAEQQSKGRKLGLILALSTRILLLLSLSYMVKLIEPLFTIFDHGLSGRSLILIFGGLFLLYKSTHEIHGKMESSEEGPKKLSRNPSFISVLIQIALLDIVFSLDSVITAVGMVDQIAVMVAAVIIAVMIMVLLSDPISRFVDNNPTVKMLALSFLLLIGMTLIAEGFDKHIPKGYIYFAMAFSVFVEVLNIHAGKKKLASKTPKSKA